MAKYIDLTTAGKKTQVVPISTSAGAADAGKMVQTDASGKLDNSLMPSGLGADSRTVVASEALNAGDLVNLYDNAGTINMRKADASQANAAYAADGYVLAAVAAGGSGTCYFDDTISGLSGLTVGATYFLSATAGGITATAPTTAGQCVQSVGKAVSATELVFERGEPIILA